MEARFISSGILRRLTRLWQTLSDDVSEVARGLFRAPAVPTLIVVTLALGLGMNASLFVLVDRLFLRAPALVRSPRSVHRIYLQEYRHATDYATTIRRRFSYPDVMAFEASTSSLAAIAAYTVDPSAELRSANDDLEVAVGYATASYFPLVGVRPEAGRFFASDEDRMGLGVHVAVLSGELWRRQYGAERAVLGRTIEIGRQEYTIVGVADDGFAGVDLNPVDIWVPLATLPVSRTRGIPWYHSRDASYLQVLTRFRTGTQARVFEKRATDAYQQSQSTDSDSRNAVLIGPINETLGPQGRDQETGIAIRLAGVALVVLLIACANVANLLIANGLKRRGATAVRLSLGLTASRLLRQNLLQTGLLVAVATMLAVVLSMWTGNALQSALMPKVRWPNEPLDARLIGYMTALAVCTTILAGVAPAVRAAEPEVAAILRTGTRQEVLRRIPVGRVLVVSQVALTVVLLACAGLFIRSLSEVNAIRIGYDPERTILAETRFRDDSSHEIELSEGLSKAAQQLAHLPGVERVALASDVPMWGYSSARLFLPGRDSIPTIGGEYPAFIRVSSGFFSATGMRIKQGRGFRENESTRSAPVVVVNETMARTFWPDQPAIGQCIVLVRRTNPCSTVIGIAEDAHRESVVESASMLFFVPLAQPPFEQAGPRALVVRTTRQASERIVEQIRRELTTAFPTARTPRVRALREIVEPQLRPWRLGARLFSTLGLLALVIAAVGLYSTLSFAVTQREREIGIRMALGARASRVIWLFLRATLADMGLGIAIGVAFALAAGRAMSALLYETSAYDPTVLLLVCIVLAISATLATMRPARRACGVDPLTAIRGD